MSAPVHEGNAARRVARVTGVQNLGPGLARVDLEGEGVGVGVAPGRFCMVEAPGRPDCILLRPFSYFRATSSNQIALLIKEVGTGTRALNNAAPGTEVAILGPLGNRFPAVDSAVWAVGGGVGAAPFGAIAQAEGLRILFGARNAGEAGFAAALREAGATVDLATDDGSEGFAGTVVELLGTRLVDERPGAIFTCGPAPMMAAVARLARANNIPCWVSLEERMGCGIGICRGCSHPDAFGGWRCICVDGPVFRAEEIFAVAGEATG